MNPFLPANGFVNSSAVHPFNRKQPDTPRGAQPFSDEAPKSFLGQSGSAASGVFGPARSLQTQLPQQQENIPYQANMYGVVPMMGGHGTMPSPFMPGSPSILQNASSTSTFQQQSAATSSSSSMSYQQQQQLQQIHYQQQTAYHQSHQTASSHLEQQHHQTNVLSTSQQQSHFQQQQSLQNAFQSLQNPPPYSSNPPSAIIQHNPNLPPGAMLITNQYAAAVDTRQQILTALDPLATPVPSEPVSMPPPSAFPRSGQSSASLWTVTPASQPTALQPVSSFSPSAPLVTPLSDSPPPARTLRSPKPTHLLSHMDGSMMVQEVFLTSGQENEYGFRCPLDLQGLWARLRQPHNGHQLRLSLRLVNQGAESVSAVCMTFLPNCFGLQADPSMSNPLVQTVAPGQTHTINVALYCCPENQRVQEAPHELSAVSLRLGFDCRGQTCWFQHDTHVPLSFFFLDQPQSSVQDWNPNRPVDVTQLSCSDQGPRLTQSKFLETWRSVDRQASSDSMIRMSVENVPWDKWFQHFESQGVLDDLRASRRNGDWSSSGQSSPSIREAIRIWEHKLSVNRIYVVAAREAASNVTQPDLVFFVSFLVGETLDRSKLVLGEIRAKAQDSWKGVEVQLLAAVNPRLLSALERAVRSILIS